MRVSHLKSRTLTLSHLKSNVDGTHGRLVVRRRRGLLNPLNVTLPLDGCAGKPFKVAPTHGEPSKVYSTYGRLVARRRRGQLTPLNLTLALDGSP